MNFRKTVALTSAGGLSLKGKELPLSTAKASRQILFSSPFGVGLKRRQHINLRIEEQQKIKCAEAHFRQFNDVEYRVVNKVGDLAQ